MTITKSPTHHPDIVRLDCDECGWYRALRHENASVVATAHATEVHGTSLELTTTDEAVNEEPEPLDERLTEYPEDNSEATQEVPVVEPDFNS